MKVHIDGSTATRPPSRRTVYADGTHDGEFREGADLELSHWVPNRTPARYKADSSTAICLAFVADRERERDFDLAVNNHVDVDGVLALYVLAAGEAALVHRRTLIEAAEIGDFWSWGEEPAQALFETLVFAMRSAQRDGVDASVVVERCFARVHAVLEGAPVPEAADGIAALARSRALVDRGEVVRTPCAPRFVHYEVPARLTAPDLARCLAVPRFNESLAAPALLLPQARARDDDQRFQLLSFETAGGWFHDLWLPGYAWAETPQRWQPPWIDRGANSDLQRFDSVPLREAARDLAADERAQGHWRVADRISPFGALAERGFPIVMSFVDGANSAASSLTAAHVRERLALALGDLP